MTRGPLGLALLGIMVVSLSVVTAPEAVAHGSRGKIYGTVLSSSGAIIANAAVVVRNEETGEQTTTTTSADGRYSVDSLEPSRYTVQASDGLEAAEVDEVQVAAGRELDIDLPLSASGSAKTAASGSESHPSVLPPGAASIPAAISPSITATAASLPASATLAQVTPAASHTPPDDTPSIKVGVTLYTDYAYQTSPEITDSDGNSVHKSQWEITRSYINITGNISHLVSFRITPDSSLESGSGSSLGGSLEFRIKYAYAQINLDDWMTKGSWIRFGQHQTPYLDFTEGIYRYRFQGTMFAERNGYFNSADQGVSFHYNFPKNYGDFHGGIWNGEGYHGPEKNNEKAAMFRVAFRPFAAASPALRGIRAGVFYDHDAYVKNAERTRLIFQAFYEHKYVTIGYEYLNAHDQVSAKEGTPNVQGKGYSIWATPKFTHGLEALFRYDHLTPDTSLDPQKKNRVIAGLAYWFPHEGNVSAALMVDYDGQIFDNLSAAPVKVVYVHALINF